jgi:hypothetical protein
VAVLGALFVVTPRGDMRQRVEATGSPSALSVAYLEAWSRVQPANETFMTVLASQYAYLGRVDDAKRMAARLDALNSSDAHRTAAFVRVSLAEQSFFALSSTDTRRPAALAEWRAQIAAAAKLARADKDLAWLASRAAASGDPRLAAQLYAQLSSGDAERRPQWDTYVTRYALEGGDYRLAAAAWFRKQDAARDRDDARRCFLSGIGVLRAGNLMDEAVAAAESHLGSLENDPATLIELVNLARAANRPDAVDRFAKMLAKYAKADGAPAHSVSPPRAYAYMDGPLPVRGNEWSGRVLADAHGGPSRGYAVIRVAATAQAGSEPAKGQPAAADIAYRAFVEAGDMANAEQLAKAQVARTPNSAVWTQRLAQAAQWNRDPALALHAWLAYARISNDPNAWQNVLRMAPMLDDDEAYLAAAEHQARAAPGDLKKVDEVTSTFERLGRPDEGIAFLRSLPKGSNSDALDTRIGQLAERAGHDDMALSAYRAVQAHRPRDIDAALRTASVLYRKGDYAAAFSALRAAGPAATDKDEVYWRNVGELARLLKRDADANEAYRHLLAGGAATDEDLGDMGQFYEPYPIDAGRVAELRFRRDHSMLALQNALYYYTQAGAMGRIETLLASLDASERQAVQASPGVLGARAEYYRLTGRPREATADLRAAVALPGANSETRSAYMWMLVDYGSDAEVADALHRVQGDANLSAAMWGPVAAAAMRLNKPVVALGYLRRQSASLSRDPLWLLTYADAQEMAGRGDLAWSIRHKVWLQLAHDQRVRSGVRQAARNQRVALASEDIDELRGRRVELSTTFATGDASLALLNDLLSGTQRTGSLQAPRSLLGSVHGLPGPGELDRGDVARNARLRHAVAKDVAIAWALSREANPLAKRWLAQQYAARLSQPADSQLAIALADNDEAQMTRLLDEARSRLPLYERIDAATATDRPGEAQRLAFAGLQGAPDDDALHTRLVETTMAWPQSIGATVTNHVEHPLDYVEQTLAATRKFADRYMIGVEGVQRFMRSTDETQLVNVPHTDRSIDFSVRRQTLDSMFAVTAGRREALNSFYTLQLAAQTGRNGPLEFGLRLGRNQTADEDQALFVGGMKDNAIGDFTWRVTPRISLTGTVEASRFYSQSRNFLGSGVLSSGELSYRIRTEYPDYTVRLVGSHGNYRASGSPDDLISRLVPVANRPVTASDLMPLTYTQYGLFFGFGDDLRTQYTRAWRPFLDAGIMHDSNQGWGPGVSVGLAGSVFGGDHAMLFFEHQRISKQGSPETQIGARYSWFY